jgi:hypothetical protein
VSSDIERSVSDEGCCVLPDGTIKIPFQSALKRLLPSPLCPIHPGLPHFDPVHEATGLSGEDVGSRDSEGFAALEVGTHHCRRGQDRRDLTGFRIDPLKVTVTHEKRLSLMAGATEKSMNHPRGLVDVGAASVREILFMAPGSGCCVSHDRTKVTVETTNDTWLGPDLCCDKVLVGPSVDDACEQARLKRDERDVGAVDMKRSLDRFVR